MFVWFRVPPSSSWNEMTSVPTFVPWPTSTLYTGLGRAVGGRGGGHKRSPRAKQKPLLNLELACLRNHHFQNLGGPSAFPSSGGNVKRELPLSR